jgi:hypothetical protein
MACDEVDRLKRRIDELERKLCERDCCKCCKRNHCYPYAPYVPYYQYVPQWGTGTVTSNVTSNVTYTNNTTSSP